MRVRRGVTFALPSAIAAILAITVPGWSDAGAAPLAPRPVPPVQLQAPAPGTALQGLSAAQTDRVLAIMKADPAIAAAFGANTTVVSVDPSYWAEGEQLIGADVSFTYQGGAAFDAMLPQAVVNPGPTFVPGLVIPQVEYRGTNVTRWVANISLVQGVVLDVVPMPGQDLIGISQVDPNLNENS